MPAESAFSGTEQYRMYGKTGKTVSEAGERGKSGEISFTFTSSRSYKIPNTDIKLGTLKVYPMSVFLNDNEVRCLSEEIFNSIEDYKKNLINMDYTKLSSISDNMVYRNSK